MLTVTIHCKKYVAHYLVKNFGKETTKGTIIFIPPKTQTRKILLSCIQKKFEPHYNETVAALPATVQIKLSGEELRKHGHTVEPYNMFFLNGVFEEKLKNEMFYEVNCDFIFSSMSISAAIRAYQQRHGFAEEIFPYETIHRAYYDLKAQMKNNSQKNMRKRSQPCTQKQ